MWGRQYYPYFTDEKSETDPRSQSASKKTGAEGL